MLKAKRMPNEPSVDKWVARQLLSLLRFGPRPLFSLCCGHWKTLIENVHVYFAPMLKNAFLQRAPFPWARSRFFKSTCFKQHAFLVDPLGVFSYFQTFMFFRPQKEGTN